MIDLASAQLSPFEGMSAVSKLSLPDQVFNSLRDALMSGRFAPGQRVPLRTIATALGTSTMPVREAVNRLVAMGALEFLPNRRVSVPALSSRRYGDLAAARVIIESSAAEAAASLLSDAQIDELTLVHAQMRACLAQLDKPEAAQTFLDLNKRFHFIVYAVNESETLMSIIESLWLQVGPYLNLVLKDSKDWFTTDQHGPLLEALQQRDARKAKITMHDNIEYAAKFMLVNNRLEAVRQID